MCAAAHDCFDLAPARHRTIARATSGSPRSRRRTSAPRRTRSSARTGSDDRVRPKAGVVAAARACVVRLRLGDVASWIVQYTLRAGDTSLAKSRRIQDPMRDRRRRNRCDATDPELLTACVRAAMTTTASRRSRRTTGYEDENGYQEEQIQPHRESPKTGKLLRIRTSKSHRRRLITR